MSKTMMIAPKTIIQLEISYPAIDVFRLNHSIALLPDGPPSVINALANSMRSGVAGSTPVKDCASQQASATWRYSGRDPPRLVLGEQLGRRSYRPILPAFAIIVPVLDHLLG